MLRGPPLVIPPDVAEQLRKLGFAGKKPEDVVRQAIRFAKDVSRSVAVGGAHVPTEAAKIRLNRLRDPLDRLAMAQPITPDVGRLLVRHGLIKPGHEITFGEASELVSHHLVLVQSGLMSAPGLVTGTKEGSFALEFNGSVLARLRKNARSGDASSQQLLERVERAREFALATRQAFSNSRVRVGLMERKRQENPRRLRRPILR